MNFYLIVARFLSIAFVIASVVGLAISQHDVVRINTDLIVFEVSVSDENGLPVSGLQEEDFLIFEDGQKLDPDFFEVIKRSEKSRPLAIVFLLDVSGSISGEESRKLRQGMEGFIDNLSGYNVNFSLVSFGMRVNKLQSFTNKKEKLKASLEKAFEDPEGLSTHAYDAADYALRMLSKHSPKTTGRFSRKVIIMLTDGFPVGDAISPKALIERANQNETSVFTVLLPSYSNNSKNRMPLLTPLELSGLSEKTGGLTFHTDRKGYSGLFDALASEITSSYLFAFYPSEKTHRDGKFRSVRIETKRGYKVRQNHPGYMIPQDK